MVEDYRKTLVACLLALFVGVHIFFTVSTFDRVIGVPLAVVISPQLDWYGRFLSGLAVAFICFAKAGRRRRSFFYAGLLTIGGSILHVIQRTQAVGLAVQGSEWLSGLATSIGVALAAGAFVGNAQQAFAVSKGRAKRLLVAFFLAELIPFQAWSIATLPRLLRPIRMYPRFDALPFVGEALRVSFPVTVALFASLTTEWLWMPLLIKTRRLRALVTCIQGGPPTSPRAVCDIGWRMASILAVALLGALVPTYQWSPHRPLGLTAPYYFSVLSNMEAKGLAAAFSTERPFLFAVLYLAQKSLSLTSLELLTVLTAVLGAALPLATYLFMHFLGVGSGLATLAALFSVFSPHLSVAVDYYLVANWVALILAMAFFMCLLRSLREKKARWVLSAVLVSSFILGVHYFTWIFVFVVAFLHLCLELLHRRTLRGVDLRFKVGLLLSCVGVAPIAVLFIVLSGSDLLSGLRLAETEVKTFLVNASPLNFFSLLTSRERLLLYFATEHYATPLTYALALIGLMRLYGEEHDWASLLKSWTMASCIGAFIVHFDELWRFLYQMPIGILAALGLNTAIDLLGLGKSSRHAGDTCHSNPTRAAITLAGLFTVGVLITFTTLPSSLFLISPCIVLLLELASPIDGGGLAILIATSLALGELARTLYVLS